ncbi:isoflavone reductase family [Pyrenophora seminiperda CCB06]|uniref:Isoflavone reductase family n=1 Tax=Pyrenophora seminiperda CCB06 TaxID=1302712 RepID=A0A3M7MID9_9PLEO|nr:isoflavone reductase family [Pyrenophora seminiperda CCB06]
MSLGCQADLGLLSKCRSFQSSAEEKDVGPYSCIIAMHNHVFVMPLPYFKALCNYDSHYRISNMAIKNVIIIGAGGNLGPAILDAFLKESSFNTTVLSRQNSTSTFPSGVKVIKADYDSLESLRDAFKGQDAVISLVGGMALGDQKKLIDAAIAAGVKRFIPSEFGSNTDDARTRAVVPPFEGKSDTVKYLKSKEKEISWTSIVTGPFLDWGLKTGFLGFDAASKTVSLYDNGEATISTTTLHQVGVTTVKVLEKEDLTKNQYVYVSEVQVSQKEILATVEKVTGAKWTVKNVSTKDVIAEGRAKLQKGDFSGIANLILGATYGKEEELGNFASQGLWNEKLGVKSEGLEETVKKANMADRAAKRMRRISTEYDESEDGWDGRGNSSIMPRLRSRAAPQALTAPSAAPTASSTRPRRGTANQSPAAAAAVIQRSSPEETRQSIHLTVKSSPNKLRQATGGAAPKAGVTLSNEAQKKKHLTAEEHAMRRAEMARRRKNLSEKRNEEEKLDTINRLLKKQPPKRGRKALQDEDGQEEEPEPERANPLFVRYIQNAKGTQLAVPDEWLQAPVGTIFTGDLQKGVQKPFSGRMVEEVS